MKFYVENFGCQMNEHDMAKMEYLLTRDGLEPGDRLEDADVVIVNTCCVRGKAEQKFYSLMGRLRTIKKTKGTLLGVTGCIAQMEQGGLADKLPFIDFALGPASIHKVREAIREASDKRMFLDFSENGGNETLFLRPGNPRRKMKAQVTIMKGCNNFCTYCIVPYVRGREKSRASREVLEEIRDLAADGVKEVTLLGQNVNSYNKGEEDLSFPELLREINGIEGLRRIRFVTSHPKDLSAGLAECFGNLDKLCESIHLPFQAGSDKVLRLMNRGYTVDEYMEKVVLLRKRCENISLTADCIVGFPGEEEEDFLKTVELVKNIGFDGIFSFVYSPRRYTAACEMDGAVTREEALTRLRFLQGVQRAITLEKNKEMEGNRVDVLVEDVSRNSPDDLTGRTRTNKIVNFRGDREMIGGLVEVAIVKGCANSLRGEQEIQGQSKEASNAEGNEGRRHHR
jgi:tRNA-2-methylthio-N6-dimethylallyladenosine synthase